MWKWLVGGFSGLVVLCGSGGYVVATSQHVRDYVKRFRPQEQAATVIVESAERGDLVRTVSAPGAIRPQTSVDISAQVSARIIELPFRERDSVRKGDVLIRLDDEDLLAALESARANLSSQEANLEGAQASVARARAALERVQLLHSSGDRSDADLEVATAEFLGAQASVQAIEHGIEMARANIRRAQRDLANTVIESPIDGTIVQLPVEVGELVLGTFNNQGSMIMRIADMSRMVLYAQIDESTVAPIQPGQRAKVYLISHPDLDFLGTVQGVKLERQTTSDGTGIYETEILLEMPEENVFRVGMTANTDIEVETLSDCIRVPSQAVLDRRVEEMPDEIRSSEYVDSDKTFARVVYKIVDGRTVETPVDVGPSDLTHTAVLAGLEEGDRIVTGPYKILVSLEHDKPVKIEGEEETAAETGVADGDGDEAGSDGDEPEQASAAATESEGT